VSEYNHLTIAAVYRLVIPYVFSEYSKIIYLDSDIVIEDDIANIFDIDLKENLLGAVMGFCKEDENDFLYNHVTKTLGIERKEFFNSGILVMNLDAFRKNKISEKCFSLLETRDDLYFLDQCALNICCNKKVVFLPRKWNYEWLYILTDRITENDMEENPSIIHYASMDKPWNSVGHLFADRFWFYARQSPFYEDILNIRQRETIRNVLEAYGLVTRMRNVVVYGAGNIGKKIVNMLASINLCKIVLWVDRDYENKKDEVMPVESIEKLFATEFDHVIIAIANEKVFLEVKEMLIQKGIPEDKILHTV